MPPWSPPLAGCWALLLCLAAAGTPCQLDAGPASSLSLEIMGGSNMADYMTLALGAALLLAVLLASSGENEEELAAGSASEAAAAASPLLSLLEHGRAALGALGACRCTIVGAVTAFVVLLAARAKTGGRIKCPVHLREAMTNFHSDLYIRKFIVPATGCETYASVLIIRKPDDANGKPRGFRFVVDLRNRNQTIRQIANQLPEASLLFEYLRDAVAISLFDVRDGYWNCPLHEESQALTAFQSEAGEWMWKCLPHGSEDCPQQAKVSSPV